MYFPLDDFVQTLYDKLCNKNFDTEYIRSIYSMYKDEFTDLLKKEFALTYMLNENTTYDKLFNILADRYAVLKTIFHIIDRINKDVESIPTELYDIILYQYGFGSLIPKMNDETKKKFIKYIYEILRKKGAKGLIESVVQNVLNIPTFKVNEYDVTIDKSGNPVLVNIDDNEKISLYDVYTSDEHWIYNPTQIKELYNNDKIKLPLRTPYYGVSISNYSDVDAVIANSIVYNTIYTEIKSNMSNTIYSDIFKRNLTLAEIWFVIKYIEQKIVNTFNIQMVDNQANNVSYVMFDKTDDNGLVNITTDAISNSDIVFESLKNITISFYVSNYNNLDNITYDTFRTYVISNWEDYVNIDPDIAEQYIYSAYSILNLTITKQDINYIDMLFNNVVKKIPTYNEKYIDKANQILYTVFILESAENDELYNLINDPEANLSLLNPSLKDFVDNIFASATFDGGDGNLSESTKTIYALLTYLYELLSQYLIKFYNYVFPVKYFVPPQISLKDTSSIVDNIIDELKPIYTRKLSSGPVTLYKFGNRWEESIPIKPLLEFELKKNMFIDYNIKDKLKENRRIIITDIYSGSVCRYYKTDTNTFRFYETYANNSKYDLIYNLFLNDVIYGIYKPHDIINASDYSNIYIHLDSDYSLGETNMILYDDNTFMHDTRNIIFDADILSLVKEKYKFITNDRTASSVPDYVEYYKPMLDIIKNSNNNVKSIIRYIKICKHTDVLSNRKIQHLRYIPHFDFNIYPLYDNTNSYFDNVTQPNTYTIYDGDVSNITPIYVYNDSSHKYDVNAAFLPSPLYDDANIYNNTVYDASDIDIYQNYMACNNNLNISSLTLNGSDNDIVFYDTMLYDENSSELYDIVKSKKSIRFFYTERNKEMWVINQPSLLLHKSTFDLISDILSDELFHDILTSNDVISTNITYRGKSYTKVTDYLNHLILLNNKVSFAIQESRSIGAKKILQDAINFDFNLNTNIKYNISENHTIDDSLLVIEFSLYDVMKYDKNYSYAE